MQRDKTGIGIRKWAFFLRQWSKRWKDLPGFFAGARPLSGWWWLEALVRLLELAGLFVAYDTLAGWLKWNTRQLTDQERSMAREVFGDRIRWDLVRLDNLALSGRMRKKNFAYVSFHTINFWKELNHSELIHELVHIWQYEQLGASYTIRALRAQRSKEGYNYGGVEQIRESLAAGGRFTDFNLEQQAEIAMDYYRLKNGWKPAWGEAGREDIHWYAQILKPFFPIPESPAS